MDTIALIIFILIVFLIVSQNKRVAAYKKTERPIHGSFQKKPLFPDDEKSDFHNLKEIADRLGLYVFPKVGLNELLAPERFNPDSKISFSQLSERQLDFVLCDGNLDVRCIILLEKPEQRGKKHKAPDGSLERVLQSVGYRVIRAGAIEPDEFEPKLREILSV